MKNQDLKLIKKIMKQELNRKWFWYFLKSVFMKKRIYKKTHWSKEKTLESKMAKRLSISAAMYVVLKKKFDEKNAFDIIRKIIVPLGVNEQLNNIKDIIFDDKYPIENFLAFYGFMGTKGIGKFVNRKLVKANPDYVHFEVRNCFFNRFYEEAGTPELTKLFCEVDNQFFARAFPAFQFHRGNDINNTIAFGKEFCTFIFEKKEKNKNEEEFNKRKG